MKGGTNLVVVKRYRCVEYPVVGVGKCRKDEGNGAVGGGGGRKAMVLVPLAVAVVVVMVVVAAAACPDAGKVSLRSARSVRTRRERESRT